MSRQKHFRKIGLILSLLAFSTNTLGSTTTLANAPLVTSSGASVLPNIFFVLDDSGSMDWNYLPDWANDTPPGFSSLPNYLFRNADFNGVFYNPAIEYAPPVKADGTSYTSMTSANTSTWSVVPNDGYGVQSSSNSNLVGNATFYTMVAGEYCSSPNLKTCTTASAPTSSYPYAAKLRWCNSTALTTCQSINTSSYRSPRTPTPRTATIVVSGSTSTSVSSITVGGVEILSGTTTASTNSGTVASNIATNINACSNSITGNCGTVGYSASVSSSTVTIQAPGATTATPTVTQSGTMTLTTNAFSHNIAGSAGENLRTDIVSTNNSYPFPGTTTKASNRNDCAGTTCTYDEEMTNYANWWAYYHTRMQMMKTAASKAFSPLCTDPDPNKCNFRVGYMSINDNTGSDFLNIKKFDSTQKAAWFSKFTSATPSNSTPLRVTLAKAGRLYAGKLNGTSLNGSTVVDPMEYSCQQNFTILSTDGYWNESSTPTKVDGTTAVGNQDNDEQRPMYDGTINGSTTTTTIVTSTTPTTTVARKQTVTGQSVTAPYSRTYKYTASTKGTGGCSSNKYLVTSVQQRYNRQISQTVTSVDDFTTTTIHTVVTTNGTVTSDTTSAPSTTSANVSSSTTVQSDTGAPTSSTTWTDLSTSTSCSSSPSPAAGTSSTSTPTIGTSTVTTTAGPTVTTLSTTGPTVGTTSTTTSTTTTTTPSSGGTSNTLADVAEYYYRTDLRSTTLTNCTGVLGLDVCQDNVPSSGLDAASWQHMSTFTLGLGASGFMQYTTDYPSAGSGDFYDVKMGTTANGTLCSWQTSGACNWPTPVSNDQTTIDDLWHAGVNGRGSYFSARDPASLTTSLSNALAGVSARLGASAAATTSNPNVTTGDNFVFTSTFISQDWTGQLVRQTLDLNTGVVSSIADWTARSQLDALAYTSRNIYTFDSSGGTGGNNLKLFTYANLNASEQAYFNSPDIDALTQFCALGATCLSAADKALAAGDNMVNFLRGDRTHEGTTDVTKYYRTRSHVLGDIVDAEAAYIRYPQENYADRGYADFVTANASRIGMVYAAANDGMLHAFKAGGSTVTTGDGVEQWAYIPSAMLPTLYKLADKDYANRHQFYVDGTPVHGDICVSNCAATDVSPAVWKTILVGGFNAGGRGYYALDVTDPAAPKALWEFSDITMGNSYGNPRIVKLANGTWVVLLTSGYNNVPPNAPSGDGQGYLYVLNANTGALIRKISTGVGSASTTVTGCAAAPCPSGLSKIAVRVVNPGYDQTAVAVYGGDLYGNVWRFDINDNIGVAGYDAQLLATLVGPTGSTQPITSKPEIGLVNNQLVIYIGTGAYLGLPDVTDTSIQSMYAIKDANNTSSYGSPRATTCASTGAANCFVQQSLSVTTCPAGTSTSICSIGQSVVTNTASPAPSVDFSTQYGWYEDFPTAGERANTDPTLALGTLLFTTNIPDTTACTAGGYSYLYFLDASTGGPVSTSSNGISATKLGNSLATRPVVVHLPNDAIVVEIMMAAPGTSSSSGGSSSTSSSSCVGGDCLQPPPQTGTPPVPPPTGSPRRASWRELITE